MSLPSNSKRQHPHLARLLIPVFIGLLWLPMLDSFTGLDHAPIPDEKRMLAKFPQFHGIVQLKPFIVGVEDYFNDHFGFRNRLIRWNNRWKRKLFGEAQTTKVIIGRNGWLFFGEGTFVHLTRQSRFSEKDLGNWQKLLESRRDWLAKRGIKYIFVIPPDKHSVYPEYLPEWMVESKLPSEVDQFLEYMHAHSTVPVLSLRQPLIEAKKLDITYLATDTHWNSFGAFVGCQELIKALSLQMPSLKPLTMDAFNHQPMDAPAGDLAIMLGQEGSLKETQQIRITPRSPLNSYKQEKNISRLIKKSPTEPDGLITTNEEGTGKALMFRDSFAAGLFPSYTFKEVVYIWRYDWDVATLEQEKPDVVIDEMLERMFVSQDPKVLMDKDHLN